MSLSKQTKYRMERNKSRSKTPSWKAELSSFIVEQMTPSLSLNIDPTSRRAATMVWLRIGEFNKENWHAVKHDLSTAVQKLSAALTHKR